MNSPSGLKPPLPDSQQREEGARAGRAGGGGMLAALTEAGDGHARHRWFWRLEVQCGRAGEYCTAAARNLPCSWWKDGWTAARGARAVQCKPTNTHAKIHCGSC